MPDTPDVAPGGHAHGGGTPNLKGALTNKLGPLPAWSWGIIVIGIAIGWQLYRQRAASSGATVYSMPGNSATDTGTSFDAYGATGGGGGGGASYGTSTNAPAGVESIQAWMNRIINGGLNDSSGQRIDAGKLTNALAAYLGGQQLTKTQAGYISNAITTYGAPGSGALPINQNPEYVRIRDSSNPNAIYQVVNGIASYVSGSEWQQANRPTPKDVLTSQGYSGLTYLGAPSSTTYYGDRSPSGNGYIWGVRPNGSVYHVEPGDKDWINAGGGKAVNWLTEADPALATLRTQTGGG